MDRLDGLLTILAMGLREKRTSKVTVAGVREVSRCLLSPRLISMRVQSKMNNQQLAIRALETGRIGLAPSSGVTVCGIILVSFRIEADKRR